MTLPTSAGVTTLVVASIPASVDVPEWYALKLSVGGSVTVTTGGSRSLARDRTAAFMPVNSACKWSLSLHVMVSSRVVLATNLTVTRLMRPVPMGSLRTAVVCAGSGTSAVSVAGPLPVACLLCLFVAWDSLSMRGWMLVRDGRVA